MLFTVEVSSATIRRGDEAISCGDLRLGDRFQVRGETTDGATVVNAELLLEEDQQEEN